MKIFSLITVFLVVVLVSVSGCSRQAARPNSGAPVLVARAMATNVPVQIDPPPVGHVLPYSVVTIRPQVGGIISQVHFQQGQEVKQGEMLFTIDPRPWQAALAHDKAQLENAEIQFNREQKLFDQKLISQDEYDTSRATRDALAATVQSDELSLGFTEIRSPIDGVAGALQFYQGNVVKAPDDTLVTLNQIHPIYVEFAVPEQYLPQIRREMESRRLKMSAVFQNLPGPAPQGELTFVDNSVDTSTGTIRLRGTFPNENNLLWPGQYVQVLLTLSELTNVVVVPAQAIQTGQNGSFVYVVTPDKAKQDDVAEERPIVAGASYEGQTVVESGLQPGETVVTDGQLRLAPGVKVAVKNSLLSTNAP